MLDHPTSLLPHVDNPFYIVAPVYKQGSAGITVLYLLCHYLNMAGERAYIVQYYPEYTPIEGAPERLSLLVQKELPAAMQTPLLTQELRDFYDARHLTPIVIYPEICDNPLHAHFFGRYILNYPGKLATKPEQLSNFDIAYSQLLAESCAREREDARLADILFIPTCDLGFWTDGPTGTLRHGSCHYAAKYKALTGKLPETIPPGSIEILGSHDMTRDRVREIFQTTELFYCCDDSALALEAQLCGCPVIFVRNETFDLPIMTVTELGTHGYCFADDPAGLAQAKQSVGRLRGTVEEHIRHVPGRIAALAQHWKKLAQQQPYQGSIHFPFLPRLVLFEKIPFY